MYKHVKKVGLEIRVMERALGPSLFNRVLRPNSPFTTQFARPKCTTQNDRNYLRNSNF